ncbi:flagellar assembly protein FliH [Enterovibrio sp. ZSDZ35]|uniref:Flagellar assembly protein FliH n=1 Tax=Enterovibrio qingdaonensis TaxID=2899818 RepID=A0ABT5QQK8_9GAMM|nr:flagellar assembly protein FliH [Enterovibrio sp. ZSDZ35]MDD1783268.1 flagellar assembly protein FliH [Enterovibrio sp. ZSDZ35]
MSLDRRRGYIRTSEQPEDVLERWEIPSYAAGKPQPKDTALNYDPSWEPPELEEPDVEPELDLSMLTAEVLEEIRQSAYEEGHEEGREAGFDEGKTSGLEQGKIEGLEAGKAEGFEQGLADGQQLVEERCRHLDVMLTKLAFPIHQIDHQVQQQVVELAMHLAKSVIQTEVMTNAQVILNTLREAVNALPMAGRQVTIYLHPDDMEVVTSAHSVESLRDREWRLIAEPSLNRGDIQVACGDSIVDYRIEDRISQALSRFAGQNLSREPELAEDETGADVLLGPDKVVTDEMVSVDQSVPEDSSSGSDTSQQDINSTGDDLSETSDISDVHNVEGENGQPV